MQVKDIVNNVKVYGLEDSIRRAKFPMNADISSLTSKLTSGIKHLAQSERASGHDQWLTGVVVQFDLTFTNKCWVEAERYHFLDFISSQSTMHRIASFDLDNAYIEYVDKNPCGFKLTAGMTTNYRQLKTIYAQRKNHRLPEWRCFCEWIETLPMSELITGDKK